MSAVINIHQFVCLSVSRFHKKNFVDEFWKTGRIDLGAGKNLTLFAAFLWTPERDKLLQRTSLSIPFSGYSNVGTCHCWTKQHGWYAVSFTFSTLNRDVCGCTKCNTASGVLRNREKTNRPLIRNLECGSSLVSGRNFEWHLAARRWGEVNCWTAWWGTHVGHHQRLCAGQHWQRPGVLTGVLTGVLMIGGHVASRSRSYDIRRHATSTCCTQTDCLASPLSWQRHLPRIIIIITHCDRQTDGRQHTALHPYIYSSSSRKEVRPLRIGKIKVDFLLSPRTFRNPMNRFFAHLSKCS